MIRFGVFLSVFAFLAAAEIFVPRRPLITTKSRRWFTNLTILALNPISVAVIYPVLPVGAAQFALGHGWGLLNQWNLPYGIEVLMGVLALDFVVYIQHVLHHAIPVLWRLHMVHHADLDYDMTTGLRFHPMEIIVSMGIKLSAVAALGPPPLAVLTFEVVLNAASMFNHSNIRLPKNIDRVLRLVVVTPDMHRVHHSVVIRETNSNYGFNFPWWDRLLGTYKAQPAKGHLDMVIGLSQFRNPRKLSLPRLLLLPFVGDPGRVPINRH